MATVGFILAFSFGCVILIFGLIFLEPLVRILGATDTILPYAKDYLGIILIGAPYMTASLVLNNQLRFQGSAMYAMIGIIAGAFLNIVLDPLFIFGLHMGIKGAALATILSQLVSFILLLAGYRKGDNIRLHLKLFHPSRADFLEIARGGAPSLFRQGLASVSVICLNYAAGIYGDAAIAAMSIVNRIMMFANSALIGYGQGFQPVCGFNYGAGKFDRVKKAFFYCVKTSFLFLLIGAVAGEIFAPQIVSVFRKGDVDVQKIGILALRLQCITFPLMGWVVLSNMMIQNIGKVVKASALAMTRQGICFIPLVLILPRFWGLNGIIMTQPIADAISFLIAIPLQVSVLREMNQKK